MLARAFGHGLGGDGSEALIEELRLDGERLNALLRDRLRVRFCWVLLPEEMSVAESGRAVAALRTDGIHVGDIIVNRLTPAPPSACALCDGRRRSEAKWVKAISAQWGGHDVGLWALTAREQPPQGIASARLVGAYPRSRVQPHECRNAGRHVRRPL